MELEYISIFLMVLLSCMKLLHTFIFYINHFKELIPYIEPS